MADGPHDTLILRRAGAYASTGSELPEDLLFAAVRRIRIAALVFAATFFMANFLPPVLIWRLDELFAEPGRYLPGTISIVVSLLVYAGLPRVRRLSQAIDWGLAYCALGAYGIASAELWDTLRVDPPDPETGFLGLSWVAVWMISFAVFIPARPWKTITALAVATAAVPLVAAVALVGAPVHVPPTPFFFGFVFPYLLAALLAYASAHVVYQLGRDVRRARELGSYTLEEPLGVGGMGEVWRARHRLLARPAAIKLIRPDVMGKAAVARFEREAQATARMCSPHTIDLYDFGVAPDGTFYYVMELLDGLDLDSMVRRFGPQPAARVIHILRQAAASLAEAHEQGLFHRDIKPANLYLCRYGRDTDFVKVLDFGLVSTTTPSEDVSLTAENRVTGTPGYMAPEQVLGNRPVDARADLYALGCVGYWLLTGSLVFEGDTVMATLLQHAKESPEPPSLRTELPVPAELDDAILACLAKSPEDRPASADALALRLSGDWVPAWTRRDADAWWEHHVPHRSDATPEGSPA